MCTVTVFLHFFFFKQKTAYEMRISDWSSDVCSSDLIALPPGSVAEVTLQDVSRADAPSTILARLTIPLEGRQVPVPFDLKVDRAQLQSGMRYSVREIGRASCRERVCQYV